MPAPDRKKATTIRRAFITVGFLAVLGVGTPAAAQTAVGDGWQVKVVPYLLGAAMNGTVGIAGREATVNASASDIFSHLTFGAMGFVTARKGNWGFGGDAIWMALESTSDQPPATVEPKQGAFAFYGLRRLAPAAELTFGIRWNVLQSSIAFSGPLEKRLEQTQQWVDPIVGLNLRTTGQGRLHARLYGEVGGFGAGSTITWQLLPTAGVDLGRHAALEVGYRWLDLDYETGEGVTRFRYDVLTQGPVFGFAFKF